MASYTVTVVDTAGIQPYIFGSNRLQENIGASELVRLATGEWALTAVTGEADVHNVAEPATGRLRPGFLIEEAQSLRAAEVIYAGGGNVVALFRSAETARRFTTHLTRKTLRDAPGLALVVAHHDDFEWQTPSRDSDPALSHIMQELLGQRLAARKASRLPSVPLLGLGVTAECASTGFAAVGTNEAWRLPGERNEPERLISREVEAKLKARDRARDRLHALFQDDLVGWYDFPSSIDRLGRIVGEESYLAVVHADGNRMGDRIKKIADDHPRAQDNRHYIEALRSFSDNVDNAARAALRQTVRLLTRSIVYDAESHCEKVGGKVPVQDGFLPFRPLVFGGDDVTFICNASVGLSLAAAYLEAYQRETHARSVHTPYLENLHACAGIAMVKMHYPFARAYALSVDLAQSAKKYVRDEKRSRPDADFSALDWHFATSGLSGALSDIRRREYMLSSNGELSTLLMRPVLLRPEPSDQDGRAWFERVEKVIVTFQKDPVWRDRRNKVKALREALRAGQQAVMAFRRAFELQQLPPLLPGQNLYREDGWWGKRCGYFDAIELVDHYMRLEPVEEK